jgi:hypothetical protein
LTGLIQAGGQTAHERYVEVQALLRDRHRELSSMFGDFRRSTALEQLGIMRAMGLLTDEDLAVFSEDTQERVRFMARPLGPDGQEAT